MAFSLFGKNADYADARLRSRKFGTESRLIKTAVFKTAGHSKMCYSLI